MTQGLPVWSSEVMSRWEIVGKYSVTTRESQSWDEDDWKEEQRDGKKLHGYIIGPLNPCCQTLGFAMT